MRQVLTFSFLNEPALTWIVEAYVLGLGRQGLQKEVRSAFSLKDQDKEKLKDNSKVATRERARLQCRELWIGHH